MDWKSVAKVIAPLAPVAGSILGGLVPFPGASMIGQKFGEAIAAQFGVPATPASVNEAIAVAGEETARAKINAAVEMARAQIQGFTEYEKAVLQAVETGLKQTGETMRAELGNEHWFFTGWRPAIGWVFGAVALAFGLMLVTVTAMAAYRSPNPLATLNEAWPLFLAYFGPLGLVVGVFIPSRSIEKKAAIENAAPMPNVKPMPSAMPTQSAPKAVTTTAKPAPGRPEIVG